MTPDDIIHWSFAVIFACVAGFALTLFAGWLWNCMRSDD